ncbi:MAG TPA: hypothetical protein VNL16_12070 [Chloroflexota bacterium]|nr:hypothetical protein [Chloroflexota bacterium]
MSANPRRPVGVELVAAAIAVNGIVSLVDALRFAELAVSGRPSATVATIDAPIGLVSLIVGLLLLRRSYKLWTLDRAGWVATVSLIGIKGVLATIRAVETPGEIDAWIGLALATITLLYLTQPRVRALFR